MIYSTLLTLCIFFYFFKQSNYFVYSPIPQQYKPKSKKENNTPKYALCYAKINESSHVLSP